MRIGVGDEGFGVWGLGLGVWGLGLGIRGLGFGVGDWDLGFVVETWRRIAGDMLVVM